MKGLVGALAERVTPAMSRSPTRVPTGSARYRHYRLAERIDGRRGMPAPGSHLECASGSTVDASQLGLRARHPGRIAAPEARSGRSGEVRAVAPGRCSGAGAGPGPRA